MVFRKYVLPFLLVLALPVFLPSAARAQKALSNSDVSVDGFFQFSSTASGNGITDTPSKSAGGAASFRHSYHWWLGYEAGYEYTRFGETYTGQAFGYQHNTHEFSGSYYAHGSTTLGIQPFVTVGASAVIFSPSLNGGQNAAYQARPGVNFGAGVNVPLLTGHFGVRLQYRGVFYKAPDFGQAALTTNSYRETSEPMAGVYLRF
jgi:hypothetical protein